MYARILKLIFVGISVALLASGARHFEAMATASGPDPSLTGAPAFGGIPQEVDCTDCHGSYNVNSGPGTFKILGLPASYVPGQKYTVTVSINQASRVRYGFQLTALDATGKPAGTFTITNSTRTQLITSSYSGGTRSYVEQKSAGATPSSTNQNDWTFDWTAPAVSVGRITLFSAGLAANGSGTGGDYVYTTSAALTPAPTTVSSADYSPANGVAVGGAASMFGVDLATSTATAATNPPPTTLGGTTVAVKDSLGVSRNALLFYVSPTQVNFQIPDATFTGVADVTVTNSLNAVSAGKVNIVSVQPGLFTLTSDGKGLPVAQLQRIRGTTDLGFENTFLLTGSVWSSIPIEWKDPGDNLYLVLYCNGVRKNSGLSAVSASIAGTTLSVQYAGAHPFFTGVDQVNVLLPTSMAGKGNVNLFLTVDGKASNTTTINFK